MEAEKYVATDCRVAARVMRYGNHFPSVQDTLIEASDRIEQLERQVAVAENALSIISQLSSRSKFAKELGNCAKHALSEMEIETDASK